MGIYKREFLRKKERKHAFDQEKSKIREKRKKTHFRPRDFKKKGKKTRFRPRKRKKTKYGPRKI